MTFARRKACLCFPLITPNHENPIPDQQATPHSTFPFSPLLWFLPRVEWRTDLIVWWWWWSSQHHLLFVYCSYIKTSYTSDKNQTLQKISSPTEIGILMYFVSSQKDENVIYKSGSGWDCCCSLFLYVLWRSNSSFGPLLVVYCH